MTVNIPTGRHTLPDQMSVLRVVQAQPEINSQSISREIGRTAGRALTALMRGKEVTAQAQRRLDGSTGMVYRITPKGVETLRNYDAAQLPRAADSAPSDRIQYGTGVYEGRELLPYQGRPGAMDAQALPSRFNNELRYRDGTAVDAREVRP